MERLIEKTNAYRIVAGDLKRGTLSHAYLVVCPDADRLAEYARALAKLIQCEDGRGCGECRACRLIDKNAYSDCTVYPEGDKILASDVDDLLSRSVVRPLENKTRLFLLVGAESMTASAQNKLLKTLEEPPANVCIILAAVSDYNLLPTVKSRVKRVEIPPFGEKELFDGLREKFTDGERLRRAISLSGGLEGKVEKYYLGEDADRNLALCRQILGEMKRSSDVIRFSGKIDQTNVRDFIAAMRAETSKLLKELVRGKPSALCEGFTTGALLAISDRLSAAEKSLNFNANVQMTVDSVLFGIVEEKHKWQKS
ncbi:MAG: hypothetical protein SOT34_00760 [Candidatus Borkfalkiaceae bacterium]|nr:hypothetical protein [Christensenellaceae bacterium]